MSSCKPTTCFTLLKLKLAMDILQIHILATKVNMSRQALCIVVCICLSILLPPFYCLVGSIYLKENLDEYSPHQTLSGTQSTCAQGFEPENCQLWDLLPWNRRRAKLYIKWQAEMNTCCICSLLLNFESRAVQCERTYAGFIFDKIHVLGPRGNRDYSVPLCLLVCPFLGCILWMFSLPLATHMLV